MTTSAININDRLFNYDLGTSTNIACPNEANNSVQKIITNLPNNFTNIEPKISIL